MSNSNNVSISPLDKLLSRLENVRQNGDGWRADCPNGHRSKLQLSIKQGDQVAVILKCWSGCDPAEVLHSLRLEMGDLFERPTETATTPQQRREISERIKMQRWKSSRDDLIVEMNVVLLAAGHTYRNEPINKTDMDRMVLAGKRIRSALEYL